MNIYVYSDESGVFDKAHNDIYVYGGVIILGTENKDAWCRKYIAAEKIIYSSLKMNKKEELKASVIPNKHKGKLYRSLNNCYKFAVIVNQNKVLDRIYKSKKDKQRYLDYVYKIAVKKAFEHLINKGILKTGDVENIYFNVDEHTTATNGRYELREALEQEFKRGTYNTEWNKFYPPIFPQVKSVNVSFCNSQTVTLVRAADIVANKIYHMGQNKCDFSNEIKNRNLNIIFLP